MRVDVLTLSPNGQPIGGMFVAPNGKTFLWRKIGHGQIAFYWRCERTRRYARFVCARYAALVLAAIAKPSLAKRFAAWVGMVAKEVVAHAPNAAQTATAAYGIWAIFSYAPNAW